MPYVKKSQGPSGYIKLSTDMGLQTGDLVRVESTGTLPAPLVAGTDYYAIRSSGTKVALAASEDDAKAGTRISLSSFGSGSITIWPREVVYVPGKHAIRDGDVLTVSSTGTLPAPLVAGTEYYCIRLSDKRVKLAATADDARNRVAIQFSSAGSGDLSVKRVKERRYRLNGMVESDKKPREIIENMLTAVAGRYFNNGGLHYIACGAWSEPIMDLSESDLRGKIVLSPRTTRRELFNAVKGKYISPDNKYQPADYPVIRNAAYEAEDGGEAIYQDLHQNFTDSPSQAQRNAKIHLEEARQQISLTLECKLRAFRARPGKVVTFTKASYGWDKKYFYVEDRSLRVIKNHSGVPMLGVDLTLRETHPSIYDWNSGQETLVDPAPDTNLPSPNDVPVPGVPSMSERLFVSPGGGLKTRVRFETAVTEWPYPLKYEFAYSIDGGEIVNLPPVDLPSVTLDDVQSGDLYLKVRAINSYGVRSDWSTERLTKIYGLTAAPAALSDVQLQKIGGLIVATWTPHPELDVRHGGRILVRHSPKAKAAAVWENAVSIGEPIAGASGSAVLPMRPGTYLFKAEDSGGRRSQEAFKVETDGAQVLAFSNLGYVQAHPAWSGTHDGTGVINGVLKLAGSGLISEITSFAEVDKLSIFGGVRSSGSYRMAAGLDLGAVKTVRLRPVIDVTGFDEFDLISKRTQPISQWPSIVGSVTGDVDATIWARATEDDPAGAPVWSDWFKLDAAEVQGRAFEFELRLSSTDAGTNIQVNEFSIYADEVSNVAA